MRPRPLQLLFVSSKTSAADRLVSALRALGVAVHDARTPAAAASLALMRTLDVILIDLNDDDPDALLVVDSLGRGRDVPIVALGGSSRGRVAALERGAFGALPTDTAAEEISALIRSITRLPERSSPGERARHADAEQFLVTIGDRAATLTPIEWKLLSILMSEPGRYFSQDELLRLVWGYELGPTSTVSVHIHRLRTKLEPTPGTAMLIRTVRGRGYAFHPPPARAPL